MSVVREHGDNQDKQILEESPPDTTRGQQLHRCQGCSALWEQFWGDPTQCHVVCNSLNTKQKELFVLPIYNIQSL